MHAQRAFGPEAAPFIAAAQGPTPTPEKILADFTNAIPDAPAPSAKINVRTPDGSQALSFKLPTAASIFSALQHLGRRRLQQLPLPDPAAGAESAQQNMQDYTEGADTSTIASAGPQPLAAPVNTLPAAGAPAPGVAVALPQPVAFAPLAALEPGYAPQPQPVAPGPLAALAPIPAEVQQFTEKLANYVAFQVRALDQQSRWWPTHVLGVKGVISPSGHHLF